MKPPPLTDVCTRPWGHSLGQFGNRTISVCWVNTMSSVYKANSVMKTQWLACSAVKWKSLGCVRLFATAWTIQSMEFSRPEYWRGYRSLLQGSSQPREQTQVSHIAGKFFTSWATREQDFRPLPPVSNIQVQHPEGGTDLHTYLCLL